jgi:hypothetical protein
MILIEREWLSGWYTESRLQGTDGAAANELHMPAGTRREYPQEAGNKILSTLKSIVTPDMFLVLSSLPV